MAPPFSLIHAQHDSYATSFNASVISCVEQKLPSATSGKKKKKKKVEKTGFVVELSDTILFPTGGGQPFDKGTVGDVNVLDVYRDNSGMVFHVLEKPIEVGTTVEMKLDWERRFDHMQMHTAQHLISAVAEKKNIKTTSWSLGADICTVEFDCSKDVVLSNLSALENTINSHIRDGRRVSSRELSRSEAAELPGMRESSNAMPAAVKSIRFVEIDGVDLNPCCGTHVQSLSELQMVKIVRVENVSRGCLISFHAGNRLLNFLSHSLTREASLTTMLSASPDQHCAKVELLLSQQKTNKNEVKRLKEDLAKSIAMDVISKGSQNSENVLHVHREEDDIPFLQSISNFVQERQNEMEQDYLLLVTGGNENGSGKFLITGKEEIVSAVGKSVAKAIEGRGGGRSGRFQGKASNLGNINEAVELMRKEMAKL
eukprot:g2137.t1